MQILFNIYFINKNTFFVLSNLSTKKKKKKKKKKKNMFYVLF